MGCRSTITTTDAVRLPGDSCKQKKSLLQGHRDTGRPGESPAGSYRRPAVKETAARSAERAALFLYCFCSNFILFHLVRRYHVPHLNRKTGKVEREQKEVSWQPDDSLRVTARALPGGTVLAIIIRGWPSRGLALVPHLQRSFSHNVLCQQLRRRSSFQTWASLHPAKETYKATLQCSRTRQRQEKNIFQNVIKPSTSDRQRCLEPQSNPCSPSKSISGSYYTVEFV